MKNPEEFKLIFLLACVLFCPATMAQTNINFAYVGDKNLSAYFGVQQGLDEANLQGQFLGNTYSLESFESVSALNASDTEFIAIIAAVNAEQLRELSQTSSFHPLINISSADNELRSRCSRNMLHIVPSEKMLVDAVRQWQQKKPGARVQATAWHEDFVKFAARDLNKRYRKKFTVGMDDLAWAGWAAVKMVSDTAVRESISDPVEMLNSLKTNLSFDGQKGLNMSFRYTGQLRQIVLLSQGGNLLGEAPVRGVSSDIDSLGINSCNK